ncbi:MULTISPECIES: SIR2 family NAD-dependent protein deacylase [unclassified Lebetimonas]|uniref:SIR2 family NAD-dependent protein deacylase n=1 Tax=unclassified Lebetimonas TaxID=2648158 RepID=UPI0004675F98|nr:MULTISPECIES: NAD-dependent deacylase [unclassified Lebetimonas]
MLKKAAELIQSSNYTVAFTGAGISVESGIPPFRGPNGLWSKYNPEILDMDFFLNHPDISWKYIKEIFYDYMYNAKPNIAHYCFAKLENLGKLKGIITQNIDNLHQDAGSKNVIEFHGTTKKLECIKCKTKYDSNKISLDKLPPLCPKCGGILKPDFVFFSEPIPKEAFEKSIELAQKCNLMIIIGTTGEIMPASQIPYLAKENGAKIIEINPDKSTYTNTITNIYIPLKATKACEKLQKLLI